MKTTLFAITLLMSGAAIAQTVPDVDVDADVGIQRDGDLDVDADLDVDPAQTAPDYTTQNSLDHGAMNHGATAQTSATGTTTQIAASATPASGPVVQPGNDDPEEDARGIAVISAPAVVPAGYNGLAGTAMGGPLTDPATAETVTDADGNYPPCTAQVTDNCLQAYERGRRPQ